MILKSTHFFQSLALGAEGGGILRYNIITVLSGFKSYTMFYTVFALEVVH